MEEVNIKLGQLNKRLTSKVLKLDKLDEMEIKMIIFQAEEELDRIINSSEFLETSYKLDNEGIEKIDVNLKRLKDRYEKKKNSWIIKFRNFIINIFSFGNLFGN